MGKDESKQAGADKAGQPVNKAELAKEQAKPAAAAPAATTAQSNSAVGGKGTKPL